MSGEGLRSRMASAEKQAMGSAPTPKPKPKLKKKIAPIKQSDAMVAAAAKGAADRQASTDADNAEIARRKKVAENKKMSLRR